MSNGLTPLATPRLSVEKSWKIRATKTVVGVIHVWKYHKCFQGRIAWFVLFRILIDMGHLNLTGANRLCIYIYTCIYIYMYQHTVQQRDRTKKERFCAFWDHIKNCVFYPLGNYFAWNQVLLDCSTTIGVEHHGTSKIELYTLAFLPLKFTSMVGLTPAVVCGTSLQDPPANPVSS